MKKTLSAALLVPTLVAFLGLGADCKKKEEEPLPLPTPSAAPTPAPTPAAIVIEEDAGIDAAEDVAPDVKKATGPARPADVAGLGACCKALAQNAASMPSPNKEYATSAAALCQGMVAAMATGSITKAGALGAIGGALRGAGLPPACH